MVTPFGLYYYHPSFASLGPRETIETDICIYGGTAAGIVAGIKAARDGWRVVVLEPGPQIGGMTTSGLGFTDIGNKSAIGGLAREFYRRMGRAYGVAEAWTFEPHVAARIFAEWLSEHDVPVYRRQYLASVRKERNRVKEICMEGGLQVRARIFIDASYEGDLMAAASVRHVVGREANATHDESLNGAQVRECHQFDYPVDPHVIPGDVSSGLLPGIEADEPVIGAGDHRVQAYCFRLCMTNAPGNRLPFQRPRDYDARKYELLRRYLAAGWTDVFRKFERLRVAAKTDTNNHGAVSTDHIGWNHAWPAANYMERERIFQEHVTYQQGYHWFLANDPSVPPAIREAYAQWGLCRDEFADTGGWPHQLYVREARRMTSDYIMTEHECRGKRVAPDPIGLAAYTMDSHNCRRFVRAGCVMNEGDVQVHGFKPYPISMRSIIPAAGDCENVIVPVCLAASHIAYGSIRMEPVFMVLGQSAATIAGLALAGNESVQQVAYSDLQIALVRDGQELEWKPEQAADMQDLHAIEY